MTVQKLIEKSLRMVGVDPTSLEGWQEQGALDHLNLVISNFAFWNPADQPISSFTALTDTINLPNYYIEIFELLLAAKEGKTYHVPLIEIQELKQEAKVLTDKLVYRQQAMSSMKPTTNVI